MIKQTVLRASPNLETFLETPEMNTVHSGYPCSRRDPDGGSELWVVSEPGAASKRVSA